ncbi:MAG: hypothetical protein JJU28_09340 [Cyclobacteriaceae bacterium]|nr:hypothetical protein [Cyclobacteriaceae bacterium]
MAESGTTFTVLLSHWIHYPEAGSYWHWRGNRGIVMQNEKTPVLRLSVPIEVEISRPQTTHVILQVTDTGTPALTRYQRVIVNILPQRLLSALS